MKKEIGIQNFTALKRSAMSEFVNPYNFVRTQHLGHEKKESPITHERFNGITGRITCALKSLTRIFIPYNQDYAENVLNLRTKHRYRQRSGNMQEHTFKYQLCGLDNKPIIPGSSLKGVIRSVAEAVSNGCGFPENNHCSKLASLCICCRLYGISAERENNFLGKVSIHDATTNEDDALETHNKGVILDSMGTPKDNKHTPFYEKNGKKRGRKFYYHQKKEKRVLDALGNQYPKTVLKSWIKVGSNFTFTVDFNNLSGEELGLLLYALELEEIKEGNEKVGMFHKIGMAKPLGFGSCEISINELEIIKNPKTRYENFGDNFIDYKDQIRSLKKGFFQEYYQVSWQQKNSLPNIYDLQKIMSFNAYQNDNIHYPSYDWFQDAKNASTLLPTIDEVYNNMNMLVE